MENLPLDRIATLVPEFAVKDLTLDRTLMMMMMMKNLRSQYYQMKQSFIFELICNETKQ